MSNVAGLKQRSRQLLNKTVSSPNPLQLVLTPKQRQQEWIEGSGVSRELTAKWLEQESGPEKIASLLAWKCYNHSPGWSVRSCDPITGVRGKTGQFKPDLPLVFPNSDKPQKYLSFPKGQGTEAIYAVMTLNDWLRISEIVGVEITNTDIDESREDLGFWVWVRNHPEIPIVLTEGAKKAGCLLSQGYSAIALCGVWNGQMEGKKLHPSLSPFIVPGRLVYLAFDADVIVKDNVEAALRQLGRLCKQAKAEVFVVTWDLLLGKGCDDLIVAHGAEAFRAAMEKATPYQEWLKSLEGQFSTGGTPKTRTGYQKKSKPPFADIKGKEIAEKYRDLLIYCDELSSWLVYELESQGIWTMVSENYVATLVDQILEAGGIEGYGTNSYVNNVIGKLKRTLFVRHWSEKPSTEFLPFDNGVLELATGKLHDHAPGFRLTWKLPRNYSPLNTGWDRIEAWLTEITQGDEAAKEMLVCFMAAVLWGRYDLQTFLYLIGAGGSGKSTFTNLVTALVGEQNTVNLDLSQLEDKHEVIKLFGKRLLICADQDSAGKKLSNFKKLTGSDRLSGRELFKNGMNFWFKGMAVVTSNPPSIFPAATANWLMRRMRLVNFNGDFSKCKPSNLMKELEAELSGLTNYLLSIPVEQIETTLKQLGQPSLNASTWEHQCRSDGLAAWINDWLVEEKNAFTLIGSNGREWLSDEEYNPASSTLYGSYALYCRQTGRTAKTTQNFSADLIEVLSRVLNWKIEKVRKRYASKVVRGIQGIRLRTEMDEVFLVEELLEKCDNRDNQNSPVTTGCDNPQSYTGGGCDNCDNPKQSLKKFESVSDRLSLLSVDEQNLEINSEGVVTPVTVVTEGIEQGVEEIATKSAEVVTPVTVVTEEQGAKSLYPELVNKRIRSLVTAKVGVVKEVIAGGHIPVMVIVQFDGEEFTIPTSPEKLAFEDGSSFPKLESVSSVSEKGTELPEPDWASYPHLTSNDKRAAQKRARAIASGMLSARDVNELKALSSKYTRTEMVWVYQNLLSVSQREQIVAVAAAQQLTLLEE